MAAGELAERFSATTILPTLVFSCEYLVAAAREEVYGLIVVDPSICSHGDRHCLRDVQDASAAPVVVVGDAGSSELTGGDTEVGRDLPDVARRGAALLEMSRPARLDRTLSWGPLELDADCHEARWRGAPLPLTTLQFRIMEILTLAAGAVVSWDALARRVWGPSSFDDRDRLVAHIRRIRKLIEEDSSCPRFLLRVGGRGIRFAAPPEADASSKIEPHSSERLPTS